MELVPLDIDGGEVLVGYLDARFIAVLVQACFDRESCRCCGITNQVHNNSLAQQGPATPALRDVAEHPVFDFVPFARAWRKMTNTDREMNLGCQFL